MRVDGDHVGPQTPVDMCYLASLSIHAENEGPSASATSCRPPVFLCVGVCWCLWVWEHLQAGGHMLLKAARPDVLTLRPRRGLGLCAGLGRQKGIKHSPSFKIPTVPWESQPGGLSSLCGGISALEASRTRFRVWLRTTCRGKSRRGPGFRLPGERTVPLQGEEPRSERR